jgi:hypothetical protein
MEFLQQMWGTMAKANKFNPLVDAIEAGLENMDKWYRKTKDTNVYFICLGKCGQTFDIHIVQSSFTALNPNWKLAYTKQKWTEDAYDAGHEQLTKVVSLLTFDNSQSPLTSLQFDRYAARFPTASTLRDNPRSAVRTNNTHATYGYSWMLSSVEGRTVADCSKAGTRDELESYLEARLEETEDIVSWWGVSIPFLLFNVVLIQCRTTQHSTRFSHEWRGTTSPFKARRRHRNARSRTQASLIQSIATGWLPTHSRRCKYSRARTVTDT